MALESISLASGANYTFIPSDCFKTTYIAFNFLTELRKEKGFTQKEVADILGISQSYISRLEKRIITQLKKDIEKITMD